VTRIQELPPELVDQIAAGEVVERPASIVKELLDNAVDAGAGRVEVEVSDGGLSRIRVTDDGEGIDEADLPLAVRTHATSKIRSSDDLFAISSLGFRGEALASIGAVSHLRLASRRRGADGGAELRVDGGAVGPVRPAGLPPGTTVEVGDLFYNVPARRAFLKTGRSELRAVLAEVRRQALCHSGVGFTVRSDGKLAVEAPPEDEPRARIAALLGRELAEDLLALPRVESEVGRLRGYVTPTDRSRGDSQQQYFFLNGRPVRDVTLLTAVKQAYQNLLPPRRHPSVLLWLDVDPASVDVNVHPQKAEVRFRHGRELFRLVVGAIQEVLRERGLVSELDLARRRAPVGAAAGAADGGVAAGEADAPGLPRGARPVGATLPLDGRGPGAGGEELEEVPIGRFVQVHRRYVVEETARGLRVLDPHALHERILYEELRERLRSAPLESQRFLFPQLLDAGPPELAALEERSGELARLGFEVAPFGRDTLAVHAAPRVLKAERVAETLRSLLSERPPLDPEEEDSGLLHDLAAHLACRSAVRFGDELSDHQIAELLRRRPHVPRGHCCPHGRPTALALSLDELDRRFGRQGTA